jgi:predicted ATP-grasp superfamily ATP-dependent carboligase
MSKIPVVILGLQETGLFVAQSLGKYNIPVFGFDSNIHAPGFYSRYIKPCLGPHPFHEPEKLLQQIIGKAKKLSSRPVLIVSTEDYLGFNAKFNEELKNWYQFIIPEPEIINRILNKSGQFSLAKQCNFNVPDHYQIITRNDFEDFQHFYADKHVIVKALDQTIWKAKVGRKAFIPGNFDELINIANSLFEKDIPFIIQQIIDGDCSNNFEYNALLINGEIVESSVIQKIRQYPPGFGAACFIRNSKNEEIEKLGQRFITQNKIEGFSNTEFKFNPADGKYYFIETNARVWSQIRLTEYNGQNFLIQYYNRLTDNTLVSKYVRKNKEIKWIDIFSDFVLWWRYLREGNMSFFRWLGSFSKTKNFGLLNFRDIRPFLHEFTQMNLFRSKKRKS